MRVTRERRVASKAVAAVSSSAAEARPEPPLIPPIAAPRGGEQSLWWKRALDLAICLPLLLACLPVIGLLALLVRLDSPGPAFFGQQRVGRNGAIFRMWKLRTMYDGCDDGRHRQAAADWFASQPDQDQYKTLADPRITGVGHWMRRLDLDELPQLINVVLGEMSLVGPRPAIPYELELYDPAYMDRLRVPPGITGLWQVTRRERLSAPEMMALDLRYVQEVSLWLDIKTIVLTAPALLLAALGRG